MNTNVVLFNFDGAYTRQNFYQNSPYEWFEYEAMSNISLFCEKDNLVYLKEKIDERKPNGIVYLGSGNYHHISYVMQTQINQPYSLVLFDHHTDTLPSPSDELISCGSWVLETLQHLPMLKKVYLIGVSEDSLTYIPKSVQDRVVAYTEHSLESNQINMMKSILKNMPTDNVYISIDKDVLDTNDAMTGWDHGILRIQDMMKMIKALFKRKAIIGVDICGEYPVNPTNEYQEETKKAVQKNNRANLLILKYLKQLFAQNDQTGELLHA